MGTDPQSPLETLGPGCRTGVLVDGGVVLGEAHDAPLPGRLRARAHFQHVAAGAVRRAVRYSVKVGV